MELGEIDFQVFWPSFYSRKQIFRTLSVEILTRYDTSARVGEMTERRAEEWIDA